MHHPSRLTVAVVVCLLGGLLVLPSIAAHAQTAVPVAVFPSPGTTAAHSQTTISFRDIAPDAIGPISVSGSASGAHLGSWTAHSDGRGASFRPGTPFTAGETVTVTTGLNLTGGADGRFSFTVARPAPTALAPASDDDFDSGASHLGPHAAATVATQSFQSRPDLQPPAITIARSTAGASGYVGVTPRGGPQYGPMIMDKRGGLVFWQNDTSHSAVLDVSVQTYKGQPVLTWWQGQSFGGYGAGEHPIFDRSYKQIATVRAGNGYASDIHDMTITPDNDALIMIYNAIPRDLTAFGGPANGSVLEAVVQQIDIATGAVEFEWHSIDHVPLSKSVIAAPTDPTKAWDYIHTNSIERDTDGNLILSGRHTHGVYKINRTTGALMWTLGAGGNFTPTNFGANDWFAFQHDTRRRANGNLSIFDNAGGPVGSHSTHGYSSGIELTLNETSMTATLAKVLRADPDVLGTSQGSFRPVSGGRNLIGWGSIGQLTEFDSAGTPVLDLKFPDGVQSYRATSIPTWHAQPTTPPDALVQRISSSTTRVHASWNGATEVVKWVVLAGPDAGHLAAVYARNRVGFETLLDAPTRANTIVVEARNAADKPLGRVTKVFQGTASQSSTLIDGYWIARTDGSVGSFGKAPELSAAALKRGQKVVGIARRKGGGYWLATADGDVAAIGAPRYGSTVHRTLTAPIVGIAAAPDGRGYWLVGADGGVFAFGSAQFFGSLGSRKINKPIVGMASTTNGKGYWLVAGDGGIFSFGSAPYIGSTGRMKLVAPVVGMAVAPKGVGYWLVASDGGVFTFGTARFFGSAANRGAKIVNISPTTEGLGYWMVGTNNSVYSFGDAQYLGTAQSSRGTSAVGLIPR